jgi:hypothetical protein
MMQQSGFSISSWSASTHINETQGLEAIHGVPYVAE